MKHGRKGSILRPKGATQPIIRITGTPEHPNADGEATLEIPDVPPDWDEILYGMFGECHDTPHAKRRRRKQ